MIKRLPRQGRALKETEFITPVGGSKHMRLTAPSFVIFLLSFIMATVVILLKYFGVTIPVISDIASGKTFEVLLLAYLLLFFGVIIRGL